MPKPIRITTFCVHGDGRSPSMARSLVSALSLKPHSGMSQLPHDKAYEAPDGRMVQIHVRRLGNVELGDHISAPVLTRYDIEDADWVISNECHHPLTLEGFGRPEMEKHLTRAERSGKLVGDPGSHENMRRHFNALVQRLDK